MKPIIHFIKNHQALIYWSLFPTLAIYTHNLDQLELARTVKPITLSLLFAFLSYLSIRLLLRQTQKANIFTSVWLIFFFSFGYIYLKLGDTWLSRILPVSLSASLSLLFILILVGVYFWLIRTTKGIKLINSLITFVGAGLILYNLVLIVPFEISRQRNSMKLSQYLQQQPSTLLKPIESSRKPDIYYFIFDRYARQDVLTQYFNFDNRILIDTLANRGFYVATQSAANYPTTFLSLASSLNFTYLDFLPSILGTSNSDRLPVYHQLLIDNQVQKLLKSQGYQTILAGDFWDPTKTNHLVDANYNLFKDFDEFHLYIYERTWLNHLLGMLADKQIYTGIKRLDLMSQNLEHRLNGIKKHVGQTQPVFVLAHFLTPHDPNVYSSECQPLSLEAMRQLHEEAGYLQELECINRVMVGISDYIITHSTRPVVIIFQSDEGPYLPAKHFNLEGEVFPNTKEATQIHTSILNTFYLSALNDPQTPLDYSALSLNPISAPVNTFRIIFNTYFGSNLPLLENHTYKYTDPSKPYAYKAVNLNF